MQGLYFVTDDRVSSDDLLLKMTGAILEKGVCAVQLREKQCPTRRFIERAEKLKQLLAGSKAKFFINDRVDVALAVQADGVHLGQNDMPYQQARKIVGPEMLIGLSVGSEEEMKEANHYDLAYVGVGTIFATTTKVDIGALLGVDGLSRICRLSRHPVIAIGGISVDNAHQAAAAGASGIAVISAISLAEDYGKAAETLLISFQG